MNSHQSDTINTRLSDAPSYANARVQHLLGLSIPSIAILLLLFPLLRGWTLYYGDLILQFIPWREYASEVLRNGFVPLWNPYVFCGMPFLANGQSGIFYPYNWLGLVVRADMLINWGALLHTLLSAWFMYALLMRLRLSPVAASTGAIAYSLSSFVIGHVQFPSLHWTLTWLPLQILAGERLARHATWWACSWLCLTLAIGFLAGHAQVWALGVAFVIAWVVVRSWEHGGHSNAIRAGGYLVISLILSLACTAVQWLPQWELLTNSAHHRVPYDEATVLSLAPWQLLGLIIPNLFGHPARGFYWGTGNWWDVSIYVGIIGFILAIIGAVRMSRRSLGLMLLVTMAVGIALSMGRFLPGYRWLFHHVPGFDMFRAPARFSLWFIIAAALFSAYGIEHIMMTLAKGNVRILKCLARFTTVAALAILLFALVGLALPQCERVFTRFFQYVVSVGELVIPPNRMHDAARSALVLSAVEMAIAAFCMLAFGTLWHIVQHRVQRLQTQSSPTPHRRVLNGMVWAIPILLAIELLIAGWDVNPMVPRLPWEANCQLKQQLHAGYGANYRISMLERDIKRCWYVHVGYSRYPKHHKRMSMLRKFIRSLTPNINMHYRYLHAQGYDPIKPEPYWSALQAAERAYLEGGAEHALAWLSVRHLIIARATEWIGDVSGKEGITRVPEQLSIGMRKLPGALPRAFIIPALPQAFSQRIINGVSHEIQALPLPAQFHAVRIATTSNPNVITIELPAEKTGWLVLTDNTWAGWYAFANSKRLRWRALHPAARLVRITRAIAGHTLVWAYLPESYALGLYLTLIGCATLAGIACVVLVLVRPIESQICG